MAINLRKTVDLAKAKVNLTKLDVAVFLDASYSMTSRYGQGSRWSVGQKAVGALAQTLGTFDDDGIDVVIFNGGYTYKAGVTAAKVDETFRTHRPDGGTVLAPPLQEAINKYLPATVNYKTVQVEETSGGFLGWGGTKKTVSKQVADGYVRTSPKKQVCLVVYTDGGPSDRSAVADVIVDATKRVNKKEDLGILFIQVGDDQDATDFLTFLDEELVKKRGASFDCVTCVKLSDLEHSSFTPEETVKLPFCGSDN